MLDIDRLPAPIALRSPGGPLSTEAITEVRSHPRFLQAVHAAVVGHLAIKRKRPLLFTDLGSLVIGNLALYLHFSHDPTDARSGLTVSRMKAICVKQGVCSSGRALAAVALMRLSGLLVPAANPADRPLRLLAPTERLIEQCRRYWEPSVTATAMVARGPSYGVEALHRADVFAAFIRTFGDCFCTGVRMFQAGADLTRFAHRNAGVSLLFALLVTAGVEAASRRPVPVRITVADLARRFAVSRPQVLRLLDDAVDAGLIERSGPDGLPITVLPQLSQSAQNLYAVVFPLCDYYMRRALEAAGKR